MAENVSFTGGSLLASLAARAMPLAARALPTILSGLTTGLLSDGINKAISGNGDGLCVHKHVLGFTPYRLHKNVDGTFVNPIRVYDGKVYVLDDVATMEVGDRYLTTDIINSKLVYFVKGDGSNGDVVALQRILGSKRFERRVW